VPEDGDGLSASTADDGPADVMLAVGGTIPARASWGLDSF
jgi:hypothetical protein